MAKTDLFYNLRYTHEGGLIEPVDQRPLSVLLHLVGLLSAPLSINSCLPCQVER